MNQRGAELGDLVREMRKSRHLTQEALAERIGVCKRTIIDIENNTGNPQFQILYALVRELDLPLFSIFYPEKKGRLVQENLLLQELGSCSEDEIHFILSLFLSCFSMPSNSGLDIAKSCIHISDKIFLSCIS